MLCPLPGQHTSHRGPGRDGGKWFSFYVYRIGIQVGVATGPQLVTLTVPVPGWVEGSSLPMLVPLLWFPCPSELQVGQISGTALPLTHSVVRTQGHSVTTKLKLRGRGEKDVPVFAAGDPGTQVGACALAGAICHERAAGGGGGRGGGAAGYGAETPRDNAQRRGCLCSTPQG